VQLITTHFDRDVDRAAFDCGKHPALNDYIAKQAGQDEKRNVSRTFMLVEEGCLVGYYTLAASSISLDELPEAQKKNLPRYPIPAVLLSRLAVHKNQQGNGVGKRLMGDVFKRVYLMSEHAGIAFLIVDAKDDEAATFYREKLKFVPSPDAPLRLAVLTSTFIAPLREKFGCLS